MHKATNMDPKIAGFGAVLIPTAFVVLNKLNNWYEKKQLEKPEVQKKNLAKKLLNIKNKSNVPDHLIQFLSDTCQIDKDNINSEEYYTKLKIFDNASEELEGSEKLNKDHEKKIKNIQNQFSYNYFIINIISQFIHLKKQLRNKERERKKHVKKLLDQLKPLTKKEKCSSGLLNQGLVNKINDEGIISKISPLDEEIEKLNTKIKSQNIFIAIIDRSDNLRGLINDEGNSAEINEKLKQLQEEMNKDKNSKNENLIDKLKNLSLFIIGSTVLFSSYSWYKKTTVDISLSILTGFTFFMMSKISNKTNNIPENKMQEERKST